MRTSEQAMPGRLVVVVLVAAAGALMAAAGASVARSAASPPGVSSPAPDRTSFVAQMRYDLTPDRSEIYVITRRAGLLRFLGHDHAIRATNWRGTLCWSEDSLSEAHAEIVVNTRALEIDSDSALALAGLRDGPSEDDRRGIQATMLGEDFLDAERHPEIRLDRATVDSGEGDGELVVRGFLTILDEVREVSFPVDLEADAEGEVRVRGVLEVRQSDFGITPESILGLVRVADPVEIHFRLVALPSGEPCQ